MYLVSVLVIVFTTQLSSSYTLTSTQPRVHYRTNKLVGVHSMSSQQFQEPKNRGRSGGADTFLASPSSHLFASDDDEGTTDVPLSNMLQIRIRDCFNRLNAMMSSIQDMIRENGKNRIGNDEKKKILKDMISVALPALAACIVEPLLTIVDSFCIGQYMSTVESTNGLAGMSVNGAIFNILAAATYPLCTATTALVSDSMGKMEAQRDTAKAASSPNDVGNETASAELKSIFINGIFLAVVLGSVVSSFLITCSNTILKIAFPDLDVAVAIEAIKYLRIRALSVPSVLINDVVVGYSLGVQNGIGPMISISLAFLTNVIGDIICIGGLKMGLTGAALATTVSSYVGSMIALSYVSAKYNLFSILFPEKRSKKEDLGPSPLNLLNPSLLKAFFDNSGLIFMGSMLETVTYSMGARIASLAGGISNYNAFVTSGLIGETMSTAAASTVDIAAHQIAMQTWWLLSYFSFPLAMVGQALLPRDIAAGRSKRAKEVIILLMKMSAVVGALSTCVSLFQPTCMPGAFTDNVVVQRAVRFVLPQVALSQFLICIATVLDGIFIGSGRLGDYVNAGVVSTASAWLYFLFSMRFKYGLVGAWNGLLLFSSVRLAYWLSRLPLLFAGVNISKKGDLSSSKDEFQ